MDFKFSGDWGEENKATATQWIKEKLTELQGEAPEDLFLEYILVMIGNGKSMEEISNELKDFVGEDEARSFANGLGAHLKSLVKPAVTKLISLATTSSKSRLDGALKTGRENSARLLTTALKSTTSQQGKIEKVSAGKDVIRDNKRKAVIVAESVELPIQKKSIASNSTRREIKLGSSSPPISTTGMTGIDMSMGSFGAMNTNPQMYMEQMKSFATMSGFASVEDFAAAMQQQQSMMMMMMMMGGGAVGLPAPHAIHSAMPPFGPQGHHNGGRNFSGGRAGGLGGRLSGREPTRGGRGSTPALLVSADVASTSPTAAAATTSVDTERGFGEGEHSVEGNEMVDEVGAGGEEYYPPAGTDAVSGGYYRGRGRGAYRGTSFRGSFRGRGSSFPPRGGGGRSFFHGRGNMTWQPPDAINAVAGAGAAVEVQVGAGDGLIVDVGAGHGGGRGQGLFAPRGGRSFGRRGGRGAPSNNLVWVREPNMESGLVSGR